LRVVLTERGLDDEVTRTVVENLDAQAAGGDLEQAFARVPADLLRRPQALAAMAEVRAVAGSLQRIEFPPGSALAQRVLWPALAVESNGMEDARFVRFTAPNGAVDCDPDKGGETRPTDPPVPPAALSPTQANSSLPTGRNPVALPTRSFRLQPGGQAPASAPRTPSDPRPGHLGSQ